MAFLIYFAILLGFTAVVLVSTRKTRFFRGVVAAACVYWLFMAVGSYHIFISRGSTSGIGFLFIPIYALLPALVGVVGLTLTTQHNLWLKTLGCLVLLGLVPMAWQTWQGITETRYTNARRDAEQKARYEAHRRYLKELRDHQSLYTTEKLLALMETKKDRAFFLAVASWKETPDAVLNKLVDYDNGSVVLSLLRHPRTPMAAIDKAVQLNDRHAFSRDLAANPYTPRQILLSLVEGLPINLGIGRALVQNPNVDCDLLRKILEHEPDSTPYQRETRDMASKRLIRECS